MGPGEDAPCAVGLALHCSSNTALALFLFAVSLQEVLRRWWSWLHGWEHVRPHYTAMNMACVSQKRLRGEKCEEDQDICSLGLFKESSAQQYHKRSCLGAPT